MSGEEIQEDSFSSDEEFDEEADSESSSDVDAKVAADEVFDKEFLKCYAALKNKDDKIYDKNVKFFSDPKPEDVGEDQDKPTKARLLPISKPKVTLLDHQLGLKDDELDEPELEGKSLLNLASNSRSNYEKELEEIKKSIGEVGDNVNSDSEDELLVVKDPKPGTSVKVNTRRNVLDKLEDDDDNDIKQLKQLWSDPKNLADEDKYLRDYILNKRYLPTNTDTDKGGFFSKNLDELSDVEEEGEVTDQRRQRRVEHHSDEKDFDKIARVPRNSTKTIRDLVEKQRKREKRLKEMQKKKKKKKQDIEDAIEFRYQEIEPVDYKMTAEEILMASDDDLEPEKGAKRSKKRKSKKLADEDDMEISVPEPESKTTKKKKKHKRGLSHKKFAQSGVAPDRLLAYGLSKTKLRKSKLL